MENVHTKIKLKSIFVSPHNDDETLFGAYIIQLFNPLVLIATDGFIQAERGEPITAEQRREETKNAMKLLSADVNFLGIKDKELTKENLNEALKGFEVDGFVFAPAIEEGGNAQHSLVGEVCDELFGDKVKHYSTYTKDRPYPAGQKQVPASLEMIGKKLRALTCYPSQSNLGSTQQYFNTTQKNEYLS